MKINVRITYNCELFAQNETDTSIIDKMNSILDPCNTKKSEFIEFVIGPNGLLQTHITEDPMEPYKWTLPKDGLYKYYKFEFLKYDKDDGNNKPIIIKEDNKLWFNSMSEENIKNIDINTILDEFFKNASIVEDFYIEDIYSLCKLEHCVFNILRLEVIPGIKSCGICNTTVEKRNQRNFLFISLQVLKQLIAEEKYEEANDILDALSLCGSLCENVNEDNSNCGCNG